MSAGPSPQAGTGDAAASVGWRAGIHRERERDERRRTRGERLSGKKGGEKHAGAPGKQKILRIV